MKPEEEKKIMQFWEKNNIHKKAKDVRINAKKFYFLDGPPYASGNIHIGTAWNKILKDSNVRFWRMRGFNVWDKAGYDTHGLPIEKKVEALLNFKHKHEIETYGIEKFNQQCRKFATEHIDTMSSEFKDLGVWLDFDNPYLTLSNEYIESAWHTFKVAFQKGLLYRGLYPVHVCPKCETAVAYNEIEYKKMTDPSIYVKFPVVGEKNTFLLGWTTTPWTLLANVFSMVHPKADYVRVRLDNKEVLIMAKNLVEKVMGDRSYKIIETFKGKKLEGMRYKTPLAHIIDFEKEIEEKGGYRVAMSEQYVNLEDGTGVVHSAPGHGKEDYKVGVEYKMPILCPVKLNGNFDERCGKFSGAFAKQSNLDVIKEVDSVGCLFSEEKIVHDYPCCWRCDSTLLLLAVNQWFFKITEIREKLIEENQKVNWHPDWAKSRMHNWLQSLGDWPVSRQRYWGIPLPIWICEKCGKTDVIGSIQEIEQLSKKKAPKDLHRPYIDSVIIKCTCNGDMKRIPDVLDVWFDSGVASWGSLGYPQNKETFEHIWPADLNIEGPDQIRGWWNSQLITSVIAFGKAPFKNILFHGFMLDAKGIKMSKSRGNIEYPPNLIAKYNRDILRLYLLSSSPWDDYYFNIKNADALSKQFLIIENTFEFVKTYVSRVKRGELKIEDKWILSKLNSLVRSSTKHLESYHPHKAVDEILSFIINDFSRTYIKLIRDRVWPAYGGDVGAFYTLYEVSKTLSRLLAPICPFLSEKIHQNVLRPLGETIESVHLCNWPVEDKDMINPDLEKYMDISLKTIEIANNIRQEKKVKLRWPLNLIIIDSKEEDVRNALKVYSNIIKQLCNVKDIKFGNAPEFKEVSSEQRERSELSEHERKYDIKVYLDTEITSELKQEAFVRELIRKIQGMRKKNALIVKDKINLYLSCSEEDLGEFIDEIKLEIGAKSINFGKVKGKKDELEFDNKKTEIGIEKI